MEEIVSSPFLELIKDENIRKLKIDSNLINDFKIVIQHINNAFQEFGLMEVKDWKSFFDRYLLTPSDEQVSIGYKKYDNAGLGGCYEKTEKMISITENNINSLCHEFIHFLVMHDSNTLNRVISDCRFLNEGMTEFLTGCVMGNGNNSTYFKEYEMAEFYCYMTGRNNPFYHFLKNEYSFSDTMYAPNNIENYARYYDNNNRSYDAYINIQREILRNGVSDFRITSFDDFVEIISAINKRPKSDIEYVNEFYIKIVEKYLDTLEIDSTQYETIQKQLLDFCKISYKYILYGEKAVSEYKIDDLHIAFDISGKYYGDFPLGGEKQSGCIQKSPQDIIVTHRDKKYRIEKEKMNFRKWDETYAKYYTNLKNYFGNIENEEYNHNSSRLK